MTMYYSIDAWVPLPDGQGPRMIPLIGSESRFENDVLREIAAEVDDAAAAFEFAGQDDNGLGYPFAPEALTSIDVNELRHLQNANRLADEVEAALTLLEETTAGNLSSVVFFVSYA